MPRPAIGLTGWPGYPKDLTRVDGYGVQQPMTLYQPLENAVARMQADDLTPEEWERLWANEYSNVWLIPAVLLE